MVTKLGRMVTNVEVFLPKMLLDPLVTWSSDSMWQTKTFLLPLWRWPPNFAEVWLIMTTSHAYSLMTLWSRDLARSHDKLKSSYLYYHDAYGYKTWQDVDLLWTVSTHKVSWPYNHILQDYMTGENHIATTTVSVATKFGRVKMYNEELLSIKSQVPLITWSCKVTQKIRSIISLALQSLWPPNLARWWFTMRSFIP